MPAGSVQRAEHLQQRALATAALADDRDELPFADMKINATQRRDAAAIKTFCQTACFINQGFKSGEPFSIMVEALWGCAG